MKAQIIIFYDFFLTTVIVIFSFRFLKSFNGLQFRVADSSSLSTTTLSFTIIA